MKVNNFQSKDGSNLDCYFVDVSTEEALKIIMSLSEQILHKNPNYGRVELYDYKGQYFTIAVVDKQENV